MPLYIKDDEVAQLVTELAKRRGTTKQDAVKLAVQAALEREPPQTLGGAPNAATHRRGCRQGVF